MRTTLLLLLVAVSLAATACGGGSNDASDSVFTVESTTTTPDDSIEGESNDISSQDDCQMLTAVAFDLGEFDTTGTGFDYAGDREFLDSYSDRAPSEIADSVGRIRDLVDRLASAAEDAGLGVNQDPSEEQLQQMQDALDYSSDEQDENGAALAELGTYAGTSC